MTGRFFRTSAALALLALLGAAASCSDDEGTAPLGQGPVVYSRTMYLQGLDEEVTMSKWPGGSIARRAGTYDAYLMWPVGATNCDGGTTIPLSWARMQ